MNIQKLLKHVFREKMIEHSDLYLKSDVAKFILGDAKCCFCSNHYFDGMNKLCHQTINDSNCEKGVSQYLQSLIYSDNHPISDFMVNKKFYSFRNYFEWNLMVRFISLFIHEGLRFDDTLFASGKFKLSKYENRTNDYVDIFENPEIYKARFYIISTAYQKYVSYSSEMITEYPDARSEVAKNIYEFLSNCVNLYISENKVSKEFKESSHICIDIARMLGYLK